jgi:hypothetical protein
MPPRAELLSLLSGTPLLPQQRLQLSSWGPAVPLAGTAGREAGCSGRPPARVSSAGLPRRGGGLTSSWRELPRPQSALLPLPLLRLTSRRQMAVPPRGVAGSVGSCRRRQVPPLGGAGGSTQSSSSSSRNYRWVTEGSMGSG